MDQNAKNIFRKDTTIIIIFTLLMWIVLGVVRSNIKNFANNLSEVYFMNTIWFLVMMFGSVSLLAVYNHLKKHKNYIYKEDIKNGGK